MALQLRDDDIDIFFDLLEEETGEDHHTQFRVFCAGGQRLGQAFANSLPLEMRRRLLDDHDFSPWNANSWTSIFQAIEFLTGASWTEQAR